MGKAVLILLLALPLAGCITDREEGAFLAGYYSRADVDALNATIACKQAARTLVQIARCEVRR
jgi:hypothetical protein